MINLAENLYSYIKLLNNQKCLLALSGGPDSMLIFFLLLYLKQSYNLDFGVIVINHKKNIHDFYQEETYINNLLAYFNIPYYLYRLQEEVVIIKNNQDFFRKFRWDKFIATAYDYNYGVVLTGHNLEDNCDTLLMRLGKSTGLYGLNSIDFQGNHWGITFLRPLLNCSRNTIENLMKNYGYFLDNSRFLPYQRNQLRKIHHHLEFCNISLTNINYSINKHQKYLSYIKSYYNNLIQYEYNYCIIDNYYSLDKLHQYHLISQGTHYLNQETYYHINQWEDDIKKNVWNKYQCHFIKFNNNLLITRQPPKKNQIYQYIIKTNQTMMINGHWIKNLLPIDFIMNYLCTLDNYHQWQLNKPLAPYLKNKIKSSMMIISNHNHIYYDISLQPPLNSPLINHPLIFNQLIILS